jgi:hypothetical protein
LKLLSEEGEVASIDQPSEEGQRLFNVCAIDGKEAILTYLWNLESPSDPGSRIAFRLSDEEFAGVMERYFEYYWLKARRV